MTSNVSTSRHGAATRLLAAAIASTLLASCMSMPPRSAKELPPTDYSAIDSTNQAVAEESQKLADRQDTLRTQIEKAGPATPTPLAPVPPTYDPLENSVVSISMYDADVGRLLWALADELHMNLIVDPKVLEQRQRATLQLRNVSAREVYNHILDAFDLYGEVRGDTLVVGQMQERLFSVDILNASSAITLSSGGDVFGASLQGAGGGGQALRGTLRMDGEIGTKNDPYKQLDTALTAILGDGKASQARDPDGPPPPEASRYSLDPGTGTLYVRARPSQIRAVAELIDHTQRVLKRQVLVEAQLIDVTLNDKFQYGVDWNLLRNRVAGIVGENTVSIPSTQVPYPDPSSATSLTRTVIFPDQSLGSAASRALGVSYLGDSFSAALTMLRSFGNIKVLSNPSLRVRNGSPAYLNVGTNIRYVTKTTTSFSNSGGNGAYNQSSDVQTDSLFSGVVIGVAPLIQDDGNVQLLVHPMQTEVDQDSLALQKFDNGNAVTLPRISIKGITTTLNIKDGDTVLLGGLIDQNMTNTDSGVPGLSDIPGLGKLFGALDKGHSTRELVLVLRVRVI
jgi:general secretion pathway protein D